MTASKIPGQWLYLALFVKEKKFKPKFKAQFCCPEVNFFWCHQYRKGTQAWSPCGGARTPTTMQSAYTYLLLCMFLLLVYSIKLITQVSCVFGNWEKSLCSQSVHSPQKHYVVYAMLSLPILTLTSPFYQPRSGMVMQNCRSKEKKEKETLAFLVIVTSVFGIFLSFFELSWKLW